MIPVSNIPAKRRIHRRRKMVATSPAPTALTLVAAVYFEGGPVRLTFDRAIDIAGLDDEEIRVDDGVNGVAYLGTPAVSMLDPQTVQIGLVEYEFSPLTDVRLTASATTGIIAVDDGGTWAGVSDLLLPFGE